MENKTTIAVEKEVKDKLSILKIELHKRTLSDLIQFLIDNLKLNKQINEVKK